MNKPCPQCGESNSHHLMMYECDKCINNKSKEPDRFIEKNGLFIPNKDNV